MPAKQKDNNTKVEPKEKPKVFQGIKTEKDTGIGGVAATFDWTRNETPLSVREYYENPKGLNYKKPAVGQQKRRGYNIPPETPREEKKKEPFNNSVAGAMSWGFKFNKPEKSKDQDNLESNKDENVNSDDKENKCEDKSLTDEENDVVDQEIEKLEQEEEVRSTARGTQTTASLHSRNKPANQNKAPKKKIDHKEGELWKMSKFTKNAKSVISTTRDEQQ